MFVINRVAVISNLYVVTVNKQPLSTRAVVACSRNTLFREGFPTIRHNNKARERGFSWG